MNKKSIKQSFLALKRLSKNNTAKKNLSFKFNSEYLNYQPFLQDFSSQHYRIFDDLANQLNLQNSIVNLFEGLVVNKTENSPALHHQYRIDKSSKNGATF